MIELAENTNIVLLSSVLAICIVLVLMVIGSFIFAVFRVMLRRMR